MLNSLGTDINENKVLCTTCNELNPLGQQKCERCGFSIYQRKPYSMSLTFVFAFAAVIFLIPANILPIMQTSLLGNASYNTIMSGVIFFFNDGDYAIAAVIFIASICIPFYKVFVLFYLLYITKFNRLHRAKFGVKLYHNIEFIGKYSMLDVFVVAILVSMMQLGFLMNIIALDAAIYFALAVIFTIMAANSFDPRLMWERT